jgi:hypothetical protein
MMKKETGSDTGHDTSSSHMTTGIKLNKRINITTFKWIVARDFRLQAFHESVSSMPLGIPLGLFKLFQYFSEIFAAHGAPLVALTSMTI